MRARVRVAALLTRPGNPWAIGRRPAPAFEPGEDEQAAARRASAHAASCAPSPAAAAVAQEAFPHMLLDTHNRRHTYLRISLTERCNLRCTYCMPAEGVALTPSKALLTADEARAALQCAVDVGLWRAGADARGHACARTRTQIERVARLFVASGVNKIRLTGARRAARGAALPDSYSPPPALTLVLVGCVAHAQAASPPCARTWRTSWRVWARYLACATWPSPPTASCSARSCQVRAARNGTLLPLAALARIATDTAGAC
jgi:hypothetical protein